jgi:1-acyl-sn-glycerol-3-phosphate acyltransferase
MSDLQGLQHGVSSVPVVPPAGSSGAARAVRAIRGSLFFLLWLPYILLVVIPIQRLVLWPATVLMPSRRARLIGAWLRVQGRVVLSLARIAAGIRVDIRGSLPAEPVVAVMNHQSVLDIPLVFSLFPGASPLIPTRERYRWSVPFVSPLLRMARFPFMSQRPTALESDLAALRDAAARVARGENSLLVFAEGHRSRNGRIGPFMRAGPRLILAQAQRPVYTIVADGMWGARTFTDALAALAHCRMRVVISGPFQPPTADKAGALLDELRDSMVATLDALRREPTA